MNWRMYREATGLAPMVRPNSDVSVSETVAISLPRSTHNAEVAIFHSLGSQVTLSRRLAGGGLRCRSIVHVLLPSKRFNPWTRYTLSRQLPEDSIGAAMFCGGERPRCVARKSIICVSREPAQYTGS